MVAMSQLDEGELRVWMIFEVLAATKETAQESLKDHAEKLSEENVEITKEEFETVQEVEKPHPEIDKGYSKVYELEMVVKSLPELIEIIISYGPTMVDLLEPEELNLGLKDLQESLNSVTQLIHNYAQSGIGGVVISSAEDSDPLNR